MSMEPADEHSDGTPTELSASFGLEAKTVLTSVSPSGMPFFCADLDEVNADNLSPRPDVKLASELAHAWRWVSVPPGIPLDGMDPARHRGVGELCIFTGLSS
ncbi:unnamed protein product [Effrenium voratum]|nr:unnamed protein product [Effrenium voratum]